MKRYFKTTSHGLPAIGDRINGSTFRTAPNTTAGNLVINAMCNAMNSNADEFKLVSRRIATASVHAASSLSITDDSKFDTLEMVLLKAIKADHWSARPRSEWERIANALDCDYLAKVTPGRIATAWRRLVKNGFVNAYQKRGERLYELNLVEAVA